MYCKLRALFAKPNGLDKWGVINNCERGRFSATLGETSKWDVMATTFGAALLSIYMYELIISHA